MGAIWFIGGIVVGGIVGWLLVRSVKVAHQARQDERLILLLQQKENLEKEVAQLNESCRALIEERASLKESLAIQEKWTVERQKLMEEQFNTLAHNLLDRSTEKITVRNKENISQILGPLKEQIARFESKVDHSNKDSLKWNAELKQQISSLATLNQQINKEAENLTKALKGESKSQGNWGEFILESILENSGLQKGMEYVVQESLVTDEGKRYQPDVVVRLPENKHLVIDSKVALVAYERYVNEADEKQKEAHLKLHIQAVRRHVKELSEKNYQLLKIGQGLDFVLLFIPIEPAFSLAVQYDPNLFAAAYEKNIVVVSPTTLIATLRTIANIWKNEHQNQNALEIARQSGNLYDKFVGLSNDLLHVGKAMDTAKNSYEDAMNKLSSGKGNLISRVERIRKLGANSTKALDKRLMERSEENEEKTLDDHEGNTEQ